MTATTDSKSELRSAGRRRAIRLGPVSITLTLAGAMSLLVAAAVGLTLYIGWSYSREVTLDLLNEKAMTAVARIETGVRGHLDPALGVADLAGRRVESGAVDLADQSRLAEFLIGALSGAPQVDFAVVFDRDFRKFGVVRQPDGSIETIQGDESGNPALRRTLAEPPVASGAYWGELVNPEGVTVINLRRVLRRNGEVVGLLAVGATVPGLSELVTRTGDLLGATAFVLYGRDNVLAHPHLTTTPGGSLAEEPVVPLDRIGDLVLANLWNGRPARGFEAARAEGIEVVRISIAGTGYVALFKSISDYGAPPWILGAWFPLSDLSDEIERLATSALGGLSVLLAAVLAAILLGRRIARPIRRVASGAREIGDLELSQVEALPPSMIRELDDQARAFNAMLASLRAFETYVPRTLVRRLIGAGGDRAVDSAERELTVMFTDIAGYTAMSEGLPAGAIAAFLNHHFALLGACVEAEGGTVDKFIGDAIMAFWGAPDEQPDHAARAARAALAMAAALEADNAARATAGEPPVRIRIGIHSGPVVVGNIGWRGRINYTIVGDTVNACQRLETLGKELDDGTAATILVSGETAAQLGADFELRPAGRFEVKGKVHSLEVHRLLP